MNILTPLNRFTDIDVLADAGANEFYIGFADQAWTDKFGMFETVNRCSAYGMNANSSKIDDVPRFVKASHRRGASLYVVLNAQCYNDDQLKWMEYYIDRIAGAGADGVIVSTPEQVEIAKGRGVKAVASTMCSVYNSDIAKYYRDLGVDRIILPRELSTEAIEKIINAVPDMEYEAFLMRNGCKHADSYCLGLHGGRFGGLCFDQAQRKPEMIFADAKNLPDEVFNSKEYNSYLYETVFHKNACGQCALYRLEKIGVTAAKIVGRMDDVNDIAATVRLTRNNLRIASKSDSEAAYLRRMEKPDNRFEFCASGMSCYYPEIRY